MIAAHFNNNIKISPSPNKIFNVYIFIYVCIIEVQLYMIWMYRHIAAFVSQYSNILYDTVKCELADFHR